jgi:uncharacterized protein (TIGR02217 family)
MSNALFIPPPGLKWGFTRTPIWSTSLVQAVSGREYRFANYSYPRYEYKLGFDVLRQTANYTELAYVAGFFNARQGAYDSFLFTDPDDNTVSLNAIGTGDGNNKLFQVVRTFGGYVEPVFDFNGAPSIFVNGSLKTLTTDYTISSTGLVTFVVAPPNGQVVAWTGSYYRRMRFKEDSAEFTQFMRLLWELGELKMVSVKP